MRSSDGKARLGHISRQGSPAVLEKGSVVKLSWPPRANDHSFRDVKRHRNRRSDMATVALAKSGSEGVPTRRYQTLSPLVNHYSTVP